MNKFFLISGTALAAISVALGALGAHGLRKIASPETVAVYQTGVQYQMYHALALILAGLAVEKFSSGLMQSAGFLFIAGVLFFSGSIYLITWFKILNRTVSPAIGVLTPFGGILFIAGWFVFLLAIIKK